MEFYIPPTQKELSQRKIEVYSDLSKILRWGRRYPIKFAEHFYGLALMDYQKIAMMGSWAVPYALWLECRGAGKDTLAAVYFQTKMLLIPNYVVYVSSNTSAQSAESFMKLEDIALQRIPSFKSATDIFAYEVEKSANSATGFLHNPAGYKFRLYNNSRMETLSSNIEGIRGKRGGVWFNETAWLGIKKFSFSALCLLNKGDSESDPENVTPCFPSSDVQPYKFEFDDNFNKLTEQLKHELSMCFASAKKKGGNVMSKELIETILKEFSLSSEQLDFEITDDMTEDTLREKLKSFTDTETKDAEDTDSASSGDGAGASESTDSQSETSTEPTGDDGEEDAPSASDDDEDEKPKKKKKLHSFAATYNQKREAISNVLDPVIDDNAEVYFWLMDFDENYAYVERYTYTDDRHEADYGRIKYAFDEKNLTAEKTGEFEKMIVKWLTVAENDELEAKRAEYEELKAFKADCVDKEHRAECDEILAKFSDLEGNEDFNTLKEKAYSFEKDALERECFVIRGKNVVSKPAKQKNNFSIKIPIHAPVEKKSKKTNEQEFMDRYSN